MFTHIVELQRLAIDCEMQSLVSVAAHYQQQQQEHESSQTRIQLVRSLKQHPTLPQPYQSYARTKESTSVACYRVSLLTTDPGYTNLLRLVQTHTTCLPSNLKDKEKIAWASSVRKASNN